MYLHTIEQPSSVSVKKNIHLVSLENMNMIHWIIDVKCLDILFPSQRLNASSLRRHDEGD